MGGRGAFALRRRNDRITNREFRGRGFNRSSRTVAGGGGNPETLANGTRVAGATNEQIQAALGAGFNRANVVRYTGAPAGSQVTISVSGSNVSVSTRNTRTNFSSSFGLRKDSDGVTFVGSSLFSQNTNNASSGAAIRGVKNGLVEGVKAGKITGITVPNAIGSGSGLAAQGSGLWAGMGVSTNLSNISGLAARPPGLSSAKTVADLMLTKSGRDWWNGTKVKQSDGTYRREGGNRRGFSGSVNLKDKSSASYKVASRFFGLKR